MIDERDEKERIELSKRAILFLLIFNKDSCIEGMENSTNPLNK